MTLQPLKYLVGHCRQRVNITAPAERPVHEPDPASASRLKLRNRNWRPALHRKGRAWPRSRPAGRDVIARARADHAVNAENIRSLASDLSGSRGHPPIATTHTSPARTGCRTSQGVPRAVPEDQPRTPQGTSEQLAELVAANRVISRWPPVRGSCFPARAPAFFAGPHHPRPNGHPLTPPGDGVGAVDASRAGGTTAVTYVSPRHGLGIAQEGLCGAGSRTERVFTARDADIINDYVRMGMRRRHRPPPWPTSATTEDLTALWRSALSARDNLGSAFRRSTRCCLALHVEFCRW